MPAECEDCSKWEQSGTYIGVCSDTTQEAYRIERSPEITDLKKTKDGKYITPSNAWCDRFIERMKNER